MAAGKVLMRDVRLNGRQATMMLGKTAAGIIRKQPGMSSKIFTRATLPETPWQHNTILRRCGREKQYHTCGRKTRRHLIFE